MEKKMLRYNEGKPEASYLGDIRYALEEVCKVFSYGATKYYRDNWKQGGKADMILDCMGRHFLKLASGEQCDDESKLHHIAHIIWNAAVYYELERTGKLDKEDAQ